MVKIGTGKKDERYSCKMLHISCFEGGAIDRNILGFGTLKITSGTLSYENTRELTTVVYNKKNNI